jgi:hypothetical protein
MHPMTRLLALCLVISACVTVRTAAASHPPFLPVQCFYDTGERAILVIDFDHHSGVLDLIGVVSPATGDAFRVGPLRFREAGPNFIWRGKKFLLRVATHEPTVPGEFSGSFRGRDDGGNPVILRDLSCTLFNVLPFRAAP